MAFRLSLDLAKCQGYANCLIEAPEIWDFDDEEDVAVLKDPDPADGLREKAAASARCCPAQAITFEEDPA
jgi:ferredoxin